MFYKSELVQYRTYRANLASKGLQIFPRIHNYINRQKYCDLLQRLAGPSCCIHGLPYVLSPNKRRWERCFWIAVLAIAVFGCFAMYSILSHRHNRQQLKIVVETTSLPVHEIYFPAVAVCPTNHVNWKRVNAAEERFLVPNASAKTRSAFRKLIINMQTLEFGYFEQFSNFNDLKGIDSFSISQLAQFVSFRCEELFLPQCIFDNKSYECCRLFVAERTEKGICLVFNSMISQESQMKKITEEKYPRKINNDGEGSGLQFVLRYNKAYQRPGNEMPFIMHLMIKEPQAWNDAITHIVYPNTRNSIQILPKLTVANNNTKYMKPERRGCLFDDEESSYYKTAKGLHYNYFNCHTHCKQEYLLKICHCTIPIFFPDTATKPECKVSDYNCIYENRGEMVTPVTYHYLILFAIYTDIFSIIKTPHESDFIKDDRRGMFCDCICSCNSLQYTITFNTDLLTDQTNKSDPMISLDIHFTNSVLTKYSAKLEYTLMDLFANFGGILGLLLGASAISFIELVYYLVMALQEAFSDRRIIWNQFRTRFRMKILRKK